MLSTAGAFLAQAACGWAVGRAPALGASSELVPQRLRPVWRGAASATARQAAKGTEVSDDKEMMERIKEWKKTRAAGAKGFGAKPVEKPGEQTAVAATAVASPPAPAAPAPAAAAPAMPAAAAKMAAAEQSSPSAPLGRELSANDAISELLRRAQQDASPAELTPQQILMVFFNFFAGWRHRNKIPGELDLTTRQKQLVILMIQSHLTYVRAAKDFWPMLCAELGAGKDPEVKELLFALTGVPQ